MPGSRTFLTSSIKIISIITSGRFACNSHYITQAPFYNKSSFQRYGRVIQIRLKETTCKNSTGTP